MKEKLICQMSPVKVVDLSIRFVQLIYNQNNSTITASEKNLKDDLFIII